MEIVIDQKALHRIKDAACAIFKDTRCPDVNLVLFQALRDYLQQQGTTPGFRVVMK